MSYLIRYEIRDTHMVEESVMMTLKDKADFSSFKPRPFNMREFYDRTGHDIKEMLLSCYFRGVECSAEDFTVVSDERNLCFRCSEGRNTIGGDWNDGKIVFLCFLGIFHVTYRYTKGFIVNMFQKKVDLSSLGHVLSS